MINLHSKIDPRDVGTDGFVLNQQERARVREIQAQIKKFQDEARPHLQDLSTATSAEAEAQALHDLGQYPADKIMELSISPTQNEVEYRTDVLAKLEALKSRFKDDDVKHFLDELKDELENIPIPNREDARDELNMQYDEMIDNMVSNLGIELVDPILVATASNTQNESMDQKNAAEQALEAIRLKIQSYQSENKLDFDLDDDFNLIKISKRSEGLNFSVIFAQKNNQEHQAYALYRGKDRILGEGGFGTVKVCQNLETSEWQAVKIIQAYAKSDSKFENEVLDTLERYHGDALRGGKYYALQTLLPGVELKKHLDEGISPDIASRLEIAKQAASLLDEFHTHFLHRDIKPENFIWDESSKKLSLCDFGLSCGLGQEETSAFGSDGFIAPEIDNAPPGEPVPYSEKSDIYALGKTFERLFKAVDNVPDEVQALITEMTEASPEKRAGDLKHIQTVLERSLDQSLSPNMPQM
ncbi:MAG: protein kinase [Legionellaceae bacterium]|nr:protein kinase [Legionellaceae bacterium]